MARAANVRVVEPAADLPGAERGNLYMLLEVRGTEGGHPTLYRNVLNAAQKAFYETEGSLATALQRAARSAHSELRKVNESLGADWRAGISCAALTGADLMVAQVNPALVLVSHPKTVDQFPPEAQPDAIALGGEDRPDVQLLRTQVEPGSLILLAESRWLDHVQPRALAVAVALESPSQAVEYLAQLSGSADLNALVIGIGVGGGDGPSKRDIPIVREPEESGLQSEAATLAEEAPPAAPTGLGGLFGRLRKHGPGAEEHSLAPESVESALPAPSPPRQTPVEISEPEPCYPDIPTTPRRTESASLQQTERTVARPADREPTVISFDTPTVVDEVVEEAEEPAEYEDRRAYRRRSRWPLLLALVIIPLLIVAVVLSMWWLRDRGQEADFLSALNGANAAIASAQGVTDEALARQSLDRAKEMLDKAASLKPNDSRLVTVQARYDDNMDRINHVTPLYGVVPLWEFSGQDTRLARVVAKGSAVYVLDVGKQQISHLTLSALGDSAKPADAPIALQRKQQVKDTDQVVSDLVDMTWVDAVTNQRSRLLALDSSGNLFSYDVAFGAARQPLTGSDQWGGTPQLMATYNGNLYLADTKANQIWRYKPTDNGYENAPEPYFENNSRPNLTGLQSIAIDGNIWLLYANGTLLKYFGGTQDAFTPAGLTPPLSGPTALAVSADGDQIYVADSGNGRIVELSKKTGQVQRQFRPAQSGTIMRDVRDMYLDEAAGIFYIATSNKLYKADLPRPGSDTGAAQPAASSGATAEPEATPVSQ